MDPLGFLKRTLVDRLGGIHTGRMNNDWVTYEYSGPFKREYDGKFCCHTKSLEEAESLARKLLPHVRNNEIIGMKHPTGDSNREDGGRSLLLVYSNEDRKQDVEQMLAESGIIQHYWVQDRVYVSYEEVLAQRLAAGRAKNITVSPASRSGHLS